MNAIMRGAPAPLREAYEAFTSRLIGPVEFQARIQAHSFEYLDECRPVPLHGWKQIDSATYKSIKDDPDALAEYRKRRAQHRAITAHNAESLRTLERLFVFYSTMRWDTARAEQVQAFAVACYQGFDWDAARHAHERAHAVEHPRGQAFGDCVWCELAHVRAEEQRWKESHRCAAAS